MKVRFMLIYEVICAIIKVQTEMKFERNRIIMAIDISAPLKEVLPVKMMCHVREEKEAAERRAILKQREEWKVLAQEYGVFAYINDCLLNFGRFDVILVHGVSEKNSEHWLISRDASAEAVVPGVPNEELYRLIVFAYRQAKYATEVIGGGYGEGFKQGIRIYVQAADEDVDWYY